MREEMGAFSYVGEPPVNSLPILIIIIQRHRFHRFTQMLL